MSAESRTLELVNRNPTIKKELLERAYGGQVRTSPAWDWTPTSWPPSWKAGEHRGWSPPGRRTRTAGSRPSCAGSAARSSCAGRHATYPPDSRRSPTQLGRIASASSAACDGSAASSSSTTPMPWGGTGWLVDPNVVITNRHVAEIVAESDGRGGFRFRISRRACHSARGWTSARSTSSTVHRRTSSCRACATSRAPISRTSRLLEIEVDGELPDRRCSVGRPLHERAEDRHHRLSRVRQPERPRGRGPLLRRHLRRQAARTGRGHPARRAASTSSCTTRRPSVATPGSVVLDLTTGQAVGLHFAGSYLVGNYAVTAGKSRRASRR